MTKNHTVMTRQSDRAHVSLDDDGTVSVTLNVGPRTFAAIASHVNDGHGITPFKVLHGDGLRVLFTLDVDAREMDVNW